VHLTLAKAGAQGEKRETIRDQKKHRGREREGGGAMERVPLVHLEGSEAARADRLFAYLEGGEFEQNVAIRAGQLMGCREWMHEGNG
jgi:hypothetical protein